MSPYNFIPYIDHEFRYDLAKSCVNCKNVDEAVLKAQQYLSFLKKIYNDVFVTITKHITQV